MHDMYIAGLCIGGIVLGPIWLYFTTKLCRWAYLSATSSFLESRKNRNERGETAGGGEVLGKGGQKGA